MKLINKIAKMLIALMRSILTLGGLIGGRPGLAPAPVGAESAVDEIGGEEVEGARVERMVKDCPLQDILAYSLAATEKRARMDLSRLPGAYRIFLSTRTEQQLNGLAYAIRNDYENAARHIVQQVIPNQDVLDTYSRRSKFTVIDGGRPNVVVSPAHDRDFVCNYEPTNSYRPKFA